MMPPMARTRNLTAASTRGRGRGARGGGHDRGRKRRNMDGNDMEHLPKKKKQKVEDDLHVLALKLNQERLQQWSTLVGYSVYQDHSVQDVSIEDATKWLYHIAKATMISQRHPKVDKKLRAWKLWSWSDEDDEDESKDIDDNDENKNSKDVIEID